MRVLALCLLCASGPALAETFCATPLQMPDLTTELASYFAISLAQDRQSLPGFPTLLVDGRAGDPPMTVRADRVALLGDVFPGATGFPTFTPVTRDGSVYGWNLLSYGGPNVLYRLGKGAAGFVPVAGLGDDPLRFAYDPAGDRLTFQRRDGVLMQVTDAGPVLSPLNPLPGIGTNVVLPILVAETGAYLMAMDDQFWSRPRDAAAGTPWVRMDHGPDALGGYQLGSRPWHAHVADKTVALPVGQEVFVLDTSVPGAPRYLYRVRETGMAAVPDGPVLIWQDQGKPGFLETVFGNEKLYNLPVLKVLTRDGPVAPPGDLVESFYPIQENGRESGLPETGMVNLPEFSAVLVRGAEGWFAYRDGRMVLQSRIDPAQMPFPTEVKRVDGHVLVPRYGGLSEIGPDLSLTPLPMPLDMPLDEFLWLYPSQVVGGTVVLAGQKAWTTTDGRDLTPVTVPPGVTLDAVGADMPDRRAVFVALNTGAGLLQPCP
jgi:hypothetical protein